jgi:hypothetical protein
LRGYGDIFLSFDVRRLWLWGKGAMDGFIVGKWRGFADVCDLSVGVSLLAMAACQPTNP